MDPALISTILLPALGALGVIGHYLRGQARSDRAQLRRARRWMQEADIHMDYLERDGYTTRGRRPPRRPPILEITHDQADAGDESAREVPADEPADQGSPRSGSRHAVRD